MKIVNIKVFVYFTISSTNTEIFENSYSTKYSSTSSLLKTVRTFNHKTNGASVSKIDKFSIKCYEVIGT